VSKHALAAADSLQCQWDKVAHNALEPCLRQPNCLSTAHQQLPLKRTPATASKAHTSNCHTSSSAAFSRHAVSALSVTPTDQHHMPCPAALSTADAAAVAGYCCLPAAGGMGCCLSLLGLRDVGSGRASLIELKAHFFQEGAAPQVRQPAAAAAAPAAAPAADMHVSHLGVQPSNRLGCRLAPSNNTPAGLPHLRMHSRQLQSISKYPSSGPLMFSLGRVREGAWGFVIVTHDNLPKLTGEFSFHTPRLAYPFIRVLPVCSPPLPGFPLAAAKATQPDALRLLSALLAANRGEAGGAASRCRCRVKHVRQLTAVVDASVGRSESSVAGSCRRSEQYTWQPPAAAAVLNASVVGQSVTHCCMCRTPHAGCVAGTTPHVFARCRH
jgi:hypothetical protein